MRALLEKPHPIVLGLIAVVSIFLLWQGVANRPEASTDSFAGNVFEGTVTEVLDERFVERTVTARSTIEQDVLVQFDGGATQEVINDLVPLKPGAKVLVQGSPFADEAGTLFVVDVQRSSHLMLLLGGFVVLSIAIARWKGVRSLIGLLFSFAIIFSVMLPQILSGMNPIVIGVGGALLILIVAIYSSYGFNKQSIAALSGIAITLVLVGVFAAFTIDSLQFSGFTGDDSVYLNIQSDIPINLVGLVVAGIVIATLGALDDVAVTQASIVFRLRKNNRKLTKSSLFREAMEVGSDHISALINTLVLAYTGAALPLLLVLSLSTVPLTHLIGGEQIAEEIVRALIASMGLLVAVPLTTAIAVAMEHD